jgi:hypothetical protein
MGVRSLHAATAAILLLSLAGVAVAGETRPASSGAPQPAGSSEHEGTRRELVFLQIETGSAYVDVLALKRGDLLDPARAGSSGFGFSYGAAVGGRVQDFTFAVRYRRGSFSDWHLWTVGGEAAVSLRYGRAVTSFGLGAGYAALGGTVADISRAFTPFTAPAVDISGLNLRALVAIDYYLLGWFSVGANLAGDAFFLHRKGDRLLRVSSTDPNSPPPFPYGTDGSANGLGTTLSLVLALHY